MTDNDLDDLHSVPAAQLLAVINREQDDLLHQLDALNKRLEEVLKQCGVKDEPSVVPFREAA